MSHMRTIGLIPTNRYSNSCSGKIKNKKSGEKASKSALRREGLKSDVCRRNSVFFYPNDFPIIETKQRVMIMKMYEDYFKYWMRTFSTYSCKVPCYFTYGSFSVRKRAFFKRKLTTMESCRTGTEILLLSWKPRCRLGFRNQDDRIHTL